MKKLIFILLIGLSTKTFAQGGAKADLKFEEAETAFNNKNYKTVITKLDEFDKLFGSVTDRSLYLRIISQNQLFQRLLAFGLPSADESKIDHLHQNDIYLMVDGIEIKDKGEVEEIFKYKNFGDLIPTRVKRGNEILDLKVSVAILPKTLVKQKIYNQESNYESLASLRKNSNAYLREMEKEGLDDKYREIYAISETLKQFPADKQTWLKEKQRIEAEKLAIIKQKELAIEEQKRFVLASFENEMILVEGGKFMMGDHDGWRPGRYAKKHEVILSSFNIGKYEISQLQWAVVMGTKPTHFENCDNCPVAGVSWNEVQTFIAKLNVLTGKNYRLPSEAEWEFAARGGNKSQNMYSYKLNKKALYEMANVSGYVGTGKPNELGIYGFVNNVAEWCNDWNDYDYYEKSPKENPKGPEAGKEKIIRGIYAEYGIGSRRHRNPEYISNWSGGSYEKDYFYKKSKNDSSLKYFYGFRLALNN